jgi:hypothetical protein
MIWGGCCRRSSGASTTDRDLSLDGSFVRWLRTGAPLGLPSDHFEARSGWTRGGSRVQVWVGLDVGKHDHHATALSPAGQPLFERGVRNASGRSRGSSGGGRARAGGAGDRPTGVDRGACDRARPRHRVPMASVPGLVVRRASEFYPGEARTDRRDSSCRPTRRARTPAGCTGWSPGASRSKSCACRPAMTTTCRALGCARSTGCATCCCRSRPRSSARSRRCFAPPLRRRSFSQSRESGSRPAPGS